MILASSSTPLLGLVDTAIIGQLGKAEYLGAIAIGTIIFNNYLIVGEIIHKRIKYYVLSEQEYLFRLSILLPLEWNKFQSEI